MWARRTRCPTIRARWCSMGAAASIRRTDFPSGTLDQIEIEPCHMLMELAPAPGAERRLIEASGQLRRPETADERRRSRRRDDLSRRSWQRGWSSISIRAIARSSRCPAFRTAPAGTTDTHQFVPLDRLSDPVGLAVSGTQLLIADRGHHRVVVVGLGRRSAARGTAPARVDGPARPVVAVRHRRGFPPTHLCERPRSDHARLDLFSSEGRWLKGWTAMGAISALAIDCDARLYAVIGDYARDAARQSCAGRRRDLGRRNQADHR